MIALKETGKEKKRARKITSELSFYYPLVSVEDLLLMADEGLEIFPVTSSY